MIKIGRLGQWSGSGEQTARRLRTHVGQSEEFATSIKNEGEPGVCGEVWCDPLPSHNLTPKASLGGPRCCPMTRGP